MEELIEEIDWNEKIVAIRPKSELRKKMFPHRAALVIPRAAGEKFLLCRRAADKQPFPDTWCCAVGGKVMAGESYEKAAQREMLEEIGLVQPLERVASFKYDGDDYKAVFALFTTEKPLAVEKCSLDAGEIQYLAEFSIPEIRKMVEEQPQEFAPTFRVALIAFAENLPKTASLKKGKLA